MNVSPAKFINVYNTRQIGWTKDKLFDKIKNMGETREGMKIGSAMNTFEKRNKIRERQMRQISSEDMEIFCGNKKSIKNKHKKIQNRIKILNEKLYKIKNLKKFKPLNKEIRNIDKQILMLKKKRLNHQNKKTIVCRQKNKKAKKSINTRIGHKK
jgi:hypothetical protein